MNNKENILDFIFDARSEELAKLTNSKEAVCLKTNELAKQLTRASALIDELIWSESRATNIKSIQKYIEEYTKRLLIVIRKYGDEDFTKEVDND